MMNSTYQVSATDRIFATLTLNGQTLTSVYNNNFMSIKDVISAIARLAGKVMGVAKLTIRNQSQGWSMSLPMSLKRKPQSNDVRTDVEVEKKMPSAVDTKAVSAASKKDGNGQYLLW